MTVTPLHGPETEAETDVTSAGDEVTLELVDPAQLLLDGNVRSEAQLDKQFVASVRDHGVLVPVTAHRTADGGLKVLFGQRRTRAAVEAGRPVIPAYVVPVPDEDQAREVARIIQQLAENDDRQELGETDRVAAHLQLAAFGLTATQIARRTHRKVGTIRTSLAVGGSELASATLARYDLTLTQAAVIAEFEEDTDAVKTLTDTAAQDPGQFEHAAQRLRDQREADAARAAVAAELTAAGIRVVEAPALGDRSVARLDHLTAADSEDELTPRAHAGCPGHAAWVRERPRWDGPAACEPVYVCTDWRAQGHRQRFGDPITGLDTSTSQGGPMSEEAKAERRVVIANNKAWDSAQTVRQQWLTGFLSRRSTPKDAPQWIAVTLASCAQDVRRAMENGHRMALQLLGLQTDPAWELYSGTPNPLLAAAETATPARAGVITLGMLLGGIEAGMDRDTWRRPNATDRSYLTALAGWGYVLSEVEQLVVQPEPDPDPTPTDDDAGSPPEPQDPAEVGTADSPVPAERPDGTGDTGGSEYAA